MNMSLQPPTKRRRKSPENLEKCRVKGCEKSHYWLKNGNFGTSVKGTSVPLTQTKYGIINAKTFVFINHPLTACQQRKTKKTQNFQTPKFVISDSLFVISDP